MLGHFVSLGLAAQKLLNKSGYAYGSIMRITHSDRDKEVKAVHRLTMPMISVSSSRRRWFV